MHPATEQLLRYFRYEHLPTQLQTVSRPFAELAEQLAGGHLGDLDGPELTVGLRKLLEAKDAAVRAALPPAPRDPALYGTTVAEHAAAGAVVCTCQAGLAAPPDRHMPSCPAVRPAQ